MSSLASKAQSSNGLKVRPYEPGDEERIVPFLEEYLGWPEVRLDCAKVDHWQWKYLSNPLRYHLVCVAESAGKVISHSASIPVHMKVGSRTITAAQGVDLCTHPDFRGQGLIGMTMACRNRMKDDHSVSLDFGFPNKAAYHVSSIKQGFRDLDVRMLQFQYIIDRDNFFRKVRFGSLKRIGYDSYLFFKRSMSGAGEDDALEIRGEAAFGSEHDRLFERASPQFDLMLLKSSSYLNWRYADPRGGTSWIRSAYRNGRLNGYMVHKVDVKNGTRFLNIVDALVDRGDEVALQALLVDAMALARDLKIETVLCCLPEKHPYNHVLTDLGFMSQVRLTGERQMGMIWFNRTGEERLTETLRGRPAVHLMLGDTDWV